MRCIAVAIGTWWTQRTDLKLWTARKPKVAESNYIARIVIELDIKSSWEVTSNPQPLFPRWTRVWGLSPGPGWMLRWNVELHFHAGNRTSNRPDPCLVTISPMLFRFRQYQQYKQALFFLIFSLSFRITKNKNIKPFCDPRYNFHCGTTMTWCFSDRASWIDYILITNFDALIIIYS